jgi:hypothetical protein
MLPATSSTSNSNSPWMFLLRCVAFLAFWIVLSQPLRLLWGSYPDEPVPTREGDTFRAIREDAHFDHLMMLTDREALAEAAKADIMFAGNSRVQYGIDYGVVTKQLARIGVRPYWLAFPYEERARFLMDVMEAGDLRPKLLILHVDANTFDRDYSRYWDHYRAMGMERASYEDFKIRTRNKVWRAFMRIAPLRQIQFRTFRPYWLRVPSVYRSVKFGDWVVAYPGFLRYKSKLYRPANRKSRSQLGESTRAHEFVEFCRARGTEVIFMTVPNPTSNEEFARRIGHGLGVTVLPIEWGDMSTFDFSHLDPKSARRNTMRVVLWLSRTGEWQRVFEMEEEPDF